MFSDHLRVLGADWPSINLNDNIQVRKLVKWLEDKHIRRLKIEDRLHLHAMDSPEEDWNEAYDAYLEMAGCPQRLRNDLKSSLAFLMQLAIGVKYEDDESIQAYTYKETKPDNPFDLLATSNPSELHSQIVAIASKLNVPVPPDDATTLRAITTVWQERKQRTKEEPSSDDVHIPLSGFPAGINAQDSLLSNAAKVLRLLYLKDMKDVQMCVDEALVHVQRETSDPKTDEKLGKVGRG